MVTVTHTFVSGIADDPTAAAAGEVLPSHWNANHTVSGVRTILTANTNYYVRVTGSDSNDGSLAHPWATIQHAVNFIAAQIDIAGFSININIGAGTFGPANPIPTMSGGGTIQFTGAGVASTTVTASSTGCLNFGFFNDTAFAMTDITFNGSLATSAGNGAIGGFAPVSINIGDALGVGTNTVNFTSSNPSAQTIVVMQDGAQCFPFATINVSGSWVNGFNIAVFGLIEDFSTWTMVGTPAFGGNFCLISGQGLYTSFGSSFSGAATGQRFNIQSGSVAESGSGPGSMGPNFFPGNSVGFCDQSSSYDGFLGTGLNYPQTTTTQRTVLAANTNFYVATTGNNSNPGTLASPWATLQHADTFISGNIDIAGFTITVNVGAGSFAGVFTDSYSGGGFVVWLGAGSANTTITPGPGGAPFAFNSPNVTNVYFNKLKIDGQGNSCIDIEVVGLTIGAGDPSFSTTDLIFTDTTSALKIANIIAESLLFFTSPSITVTAPHGINTAFNLSAVAQIQDFAGWTVTGTPAIATAWLSASDGSLYVSGGASYTAAGTTGTRVNFIDGSICVAPNSTFFPGNTFGVVDPSSSYAGFHGHIEAAGLPTTTQFPIAGTGGLYKDTSGGGVYMVYNDASTIKKVQLT